MQNTETEVGKSSDSLSFSRQVCYPSAELSENDHQLAEIKRYCEIQGVKMTYGMTVLDMVKKLTK